LFLLEVSPLALSTARAAPDDFPEERAFLAELHSFTSHPNLQYPIYASDRGHQILARSLRRWLGKTRLFLHDDGWLEVRPTVDEKRLANNLRQKLADYAELIESNAFSTERAMHLRRTIQMLSKHGRAVLVRMPVDPGLAAIERAYSPDFDAQMATLARECNAAYVDLSDLNDAVKTNDGSHLQRDAARFVSRELAARLALSNRT
jgi:hypothetical protein